MSPNLSPRAWTGFLVALVVTCMVAAGWYVQTRPQTVPPPAWYWPRVHQIERQHARVVRVDQRRERREHREIRGLVLEIERYAR